MTRKSVFEILERPNSSFLQVSELADSQYLYNNYPDDNFPSIATYSKCKSRLLIYGKYCLWFLDCNLTLEALA